MTAAPDPRAGNRQKKKHARLPAIPSADGQSRPAIRRRIVRRVNTHPGHHDDDRPSRRACPRVNAHATPTAPSSKQKNEQRYRRRRAPGPGRRSSTGPDPRAVISIAPELTRPTARGRRRRARRPRCRLSAQSSPRSRDEGLRGRRARGDRGGQARRSRGVCRIAANSAGKAVRSPSEDVRRSGRTLSRGLGEKRRDDVGDAVRERVRPECGRAERAQRDVVQIRREEVDEPGERQILPIAEEWRKRSRLNDHRALGLTGAASQYDDKQSHRLDELGDDQTPDAQAGDQEPECQSDIGDGARSPQAHAPGRRSPARVSLVGSPTSS